MTLLPQTKLKEIGFFLLLFGVVLLPNISLGQEAINPLTEAQTLIDSGKAEEAYVLLKPYQAQLEGEPAFDYVFALAAQDTGRTVEAIFALERVVDNFPEHGPARAELAKAYLSLGETDDAKKEFEKVKELGDMPPEARQTIDRYLSGIELFHDRTRLSFRPWIALAMGYDTNINGATDEKSMTIPIAPGLPFALGGTQNSPILSASLGLSLSKPLNNDLGLSAFGSAQLGDRHTTHQNDFTSHTASGRAGFRLEREKHNFSIAADASILRLDAGCLARADRKTAGISSEWQFAPTERDQISAYFQFSAMRNPKQSIRDVNRGMIGLNYGHAFIDITGTPIVFASIFGGIEDERADTNADHFGKNLFGGRIGLSYQLSERQTAFGAFTYQRSLHETGDPVFLVRRHDTFFDLSAGYRFQFDKHLSISPTIVYNDNDSNILTNDYDRLEVMVTARYDF
ncbi:MAG: porin family protein [Pseudomonadota bacterium]|nr:porin family protein [Pseudomonadota bacterium]